MEHRSKQIAQIFQQGVSGLVAAEFSLGATPEIVVKQPLKN
jgi:hypothetical protein